MRTLKTVADAAKHGLLVTLTCKTCSNQASFMARDLAVSAGPMLTLDSKRYLCSACGGRDVEAFYDFLDTVKMRANLGNASPGKPRRSRCWKAAAVIRTGSASRLRRLISGTSFSAIASAANTMVTSAGQNWSAGSDRGPR